MKTTDITGMTGDTYPVNENSIKALSPVTDLIVKRAVRAFLALLPITYEIPLTQPVELNPTQRNSRYDCIFVNK